MKRVLRNAFTMLMLCSLLLIVNVGTTMASEPGYNITEAYVTGAVTVDGSWGSGEWEDAWLEHINPDARFAYKMDTNAGPYLMSWLVEFNDTTNDVDDLWQICIDGTPTDPGDSTPQVYDHKIEIEGHTTLNLYDGDGTGWVINQTTTPITWSDSLTTTPTDSSTHYVLEIQVDKGTLAPWGTQTPPHGLRVAMYDASNPSQGWVEWPPTDPDVPDSWGLIADFAETIPEGFSLLIVGILSTVAVAASFYFLRKRPRTES